MDNAIRHSRELGNIIRNLRRQRGWTQRELGAKVIRDNGKCYSNTAVSHWESGRRDVDGSILVQLAQIFGIPVGEFFPPEQSLNETKPVSKRLPVVTHTKLVDGVLAYDHTATEIAPLGSDTTDGWWFDILDKSMSPKFNPGDRVFFHPHIGTKIDGKVAAIVEKASPNTLYIAQVFMADQHCIVQCLGNGTRPRLLERDGILICAPILYTIWGGR